MKFYICERKIIKDFDSMNEAMAYIDGAIIFGNTNLYITSSLSDKELLNYLKEKNERITD